MVTLLWAAAAGAAGPDAPALVFLRDGVEVARVPVAELASACGARVVKVEDPYYGRAKRFRVCPLEQVLRRGFGSLQGLASRQLLLRALDGYTRAVEGRALLTPGGFLAVADADREEAGLAGWEPIDRRQVDPGPLYLVWQGEERSDVHRWPWPYQLAQIEVVRFEERHPHTVPHGLPEDGEAWRGYRLFRNQCFSCHAINGEGGRVGPELNVPRSIVEYRPEEQIRDYIRDPRSFRYTSMPSHQHLGDGELDALLAYFRAMSERKHDPGPGSGH